MTASVIVEGCINTVGSKWWIKVMNPLEETQLVTPNDVLAFAEECAVPEVDREHRKVSRFTIFIQNRYSHIKVENSCRSSTGRQAN